MAENLTTASPFSRYGYGELQSMSVGATRAMGGIGYGIRDHRIINPMNPASYSSIDSLTFMMNLAGSGIVNGVSDGREIYNQFRGSVDYVAFQFPIYKFMGLSFGVMPYSSVGYKYSTSYTQPNYVTADSLTTIKQSYEGSGGFTQLYAGLSFNILNRVAIGANARFMFGNVVHSRAVTFPDETSYKSTYQSNTIYSSSWLCDVGIQYMQPIDSRFTLIFGATYSFKLPMNIRSQIITTTNKTDTDDTGYGFDYPNTVGAGVSFKMGEQVIAGVDFTWMDYSNARYFSVTDTLKTTFRVGAGVEFIPRVGSKKYGENLRFRIGMSYQPSYVKINNYRYDEVSVTAGIGFPLFNNLTTLNLFLEYGHRGMINGVGLVEDYFRFGIDVSLNERWFVKRKLN